jgi:malonyl-CoA/methylmalonyl-CoA synthetase
VPAEWILRQSIWTLLASGSPELRPAVCPPDCYNLPMLLGDLFDLSLRGRAESVGLVADGPSGAVELTFGAIDARAGRLANALVRRGLKPGDRVVVHLANRMEFLELFIARVRSGFVFVPVNVLYREREIAHIVADADPALIVTSASAMALFPDATPVVDIEEFTRSAASLEPVAERAPLDGDAPVAIVYTSGTTGRSKGAVLSHNNFLANTTALVTCWGITSSDRYLAALPLFHVHGLGNGVCSWLASGCTMRLVERFDASRVAQWFADFQPTLFFGVPTMYVRLLELPVETARTIGERMRLFVSGSAPLPANVLEAFRERFGHVILERYGMSETLMLTSNLLSGERRAGTVGYPLPGVSLSVRDTSGNGVDNGTVGDVWVRGPAVFNGYWRNAEATARAFRDGWFATGDVGQLDTDGCLTLRGRSTELIISGGFNIYPREIEEVLLELDGVREAAVIGAPDERRGEVPVAYVVTEAGVDLERLRERCAQSLASFKAPRAVVRVDALPRNALGKLQKHLLPVPPA